MLLRHNFKKGLRWIVGNGEKISFWFDNWVFQYPIGEVCPVIRSTESLNVAFFVDHESQWDVSLLVEVVPVAMVSSIQGIFLPKNHIEDKLVRGLSTDGCYSVKSGVALLQGYGLSNPELESFP